MHSDLIVMVFGDETAALKTWQALKLMRNSPFLGLLNAIVVTRNRAGKVVVHQQWELPDHPPDPSSKVPRTLVKVLLGNGLKDDPQSGPGTGPKTGMQKLVCAGLDEMFVRMVVSALSPNSSMLVNYVWRESLVDPQQVLDALRQLKGILYHTTVPAKVEEAILKLK